MGANAQTTVPKFVAANTLPASSLNITAGTGIPVFANTTTRDAAFGGSNKALAQGQTCYLESTNVVQYYNGSAWATVGPSVAPSSGLAFITSTAVSGTSFSINNCFSATYNNYRIVYPFTVSDQAFTMRLRVGGTDNSSANYDKQRLFVDGTSVTGLRASGATSWADFVASSGASYFVMDIFNPFVAAMTAGHVNNGYNASTSSQYTIFSLQQRQATSFDGFTISGSNTMTGTCYVYGYSLS